MGQTLGERLTLAGRVLVLLTLFVAVGGPVAYFALTWEELPVGSYPILFFVLPVLAGAAVFLFIGANVLRWLGILIWREDGKTVPPVPPPAESSHDARQGFHRPHRSSSFRC